MDRRLSVSPAFVALLCGMIWFDDGGWSLPFLLAAALHEAGHLLVLRCFGVRVSHVRIGLTGAEIETAFPSLRAEFWIALAGPLVNALPILPCYRLWPQFSLVNALLLGYNLLPVYPLDGGRAARVLFLRLLGLTNGERAGRICTVVTVLLAAACGVYLTFGRRLGPLPCVFAAIFLCRLPIWPCQTHHSLIE